MLTTICYLIEHRTKAKTPAKFFKNIAKRIYTAPGLLKIIMNNAWHQIRGVKCGALSVIGKVRIEGVRSRLIIGEGSSLGRVNISLYECVQIGSKVVINDDVKLLTGSHDTQANNWRHKNGGIMIDDYSWICNGAVILPGTRIGRGAVIGAGAVVSGSVAAYSIIVGNPGRQIKRSRAQQLDYHPTHLLAPFEAWINQLPESKDLYEK